MINDLGKMLCFALSCLWGGSYLADHARLLAQPAGSVDGVVFCVAVGPR